MSVDHANPHIRPGETANARSAKKAIHARSLPSFAGVALADILANGVTIVIIMIVITLMVRHQEEQEKLEQTQEVSVLLSRELASSFVMNALPTSPPARLHDYKTSPLDRNPQHSKMPIIELHDEFIRDYYTGRRYLRDELLLQNNAFDNYLRSLTPQQLLALRVDIYSIRQFYIAMSILKAHQHTPRHWHFLGESGDLDQGEFDSGVLKALKSDRIWQDDLTPGKGGALTGKMGTTEGLTPTPPTDVVPDKTPSGTENYPFSGRFSSGQPTYGAGNNWTVPQEYFDLPNSNANGTDKDASEAGQAANITPGAPNTQRFRIADPSLAGISESESEPIAVVGLDVLRGLFAFMREVQQETDLHLPSRLVGFRFERDIGLAVWPPVFETPRYIALFADLQRLLGRSGLLSSDGVGLPLTVTADPTVRGQVLAVPLNVPIAAAEWRQGNDQTLPEDLPVAPEVSVRLGLHAEIYQGLRVPLELGSIVLMSPPETVPDPVAKWRVATLASPALDDFVTGFVYGRIDEAGELRIAMDENAVEVHGLWVESRFPPLPWRHRWWRLIFYSVIAAIAIALIFNRYRST